MKKLALVIANILAAYNKRKTSVVSDQTNTDVSRKKYLGNIFHLNYTLNLMKKQGRKI